MVSPSRIDRVVLMVSTGVATSTIRSKVEQKRSMEMQSLRNLMILLSRSLCCVIKWLALLDVKNSGLKICLFNTTISLPAQQCSTAEVNDLTPQSV